MSARQEINQTRKKFAEAMKRFEYILLFRPSASSPLSWRECLVFSGVVHLARKKAKVSARAIGELTGLDRNAIPGVLQALRDAGLLDSENAVLKPEKPARFFATTRGVTEGHWIKGLAYGRYLRPKGEGWKPIQSSFLGTLVAIAPVATSVSYLATITGIDRKQVRKLLAEMEEYGLATRREGERLILDYAEFSPDGDNFTKRPVAAKKAKEYPSVLVDLVAKGKIPESYLEELTEVYMRTTKYVYDNEVRQIVDNCIDLHQTFVPKSGEKKPYPSWRLIEKKLEGAAEKKAATTWAA